MGGSSHSTDVAPHAQSFQGSFWWWDIFKVNNIYRSIAVVKPITGDTIIFWKDFWHNETLLCDRYNGLYSFALDEDASVVNVFQKDLAELFALPLSMQAFEEYTNMQALLSSLTTDPTLI
jgi:hypothetical protein